MKRLVFRLSSLGDVILASVALEASAKGPELTAFDWVVLREYAELIEGHPHVKRLWIFDSRDGLAGWIRLCWSLWNEQYDEIIDLHGSLRTIIARWLFRWWRLRFSANKQFRWNTIGKQRLRLCGYFLFKRAWPKRMRPRPVVERAAILSGGSGFERPNLRYLSRCLSTVPGGAQLQGREYLCVMPGSRWPGKCWPTEAFMDLLRSSRLLPVVLGTPSDKECLALLSRLSVCGREYFSGVGLWSLRDTACVLAGAVAYLGNDTGLAHLAEAMGTPACVVFGPTVPDMGFGPWRPESRTAGMDLWCRPCSKDGRWCFRLRDRYRCMKGLSVEIVKNVLPRQKD